MTFPTGHPDDKCQMCGGPCPEEGKEPWKDYDSFPWKMHPTNLACCSFDCLYKAIQGNAAFRFIRTLKNMQRVPYEMFKDHFEFDEDGGYARNMWDKMRSDPLMFIYGLDPTNVLKVLDFKV